MRSRKKLKGRLLQTSSVLFLSAPLISLVLLLVIQQPLEDRILASADLDRGNGHFMDVGMLYFGRLVLSSGLVLVGFILIAIGSIKTPPEVIKIRNFAWICFVLGVAGTLALALF